MNRGKTAAAVVGAHGIATLQGQLHRKLNESGYPNAPRVIGVVAGLTSIGLAITGRTNGAILALGSSGGQAAIESAAVDFWPSKEGK